MIILVLECILIPTQFHRNALIDAFSKVASVLLIDQHTKSTGLGVVGNTDNSSVISLDIRKSRTEHTEKS